MDPILSTANGPLRDVATAHHWSANLLLIASETQASALKWITDLELGYKPASLVELAIGANNAFAVTPDLLDLPTVRLQRPLS